ncbi:MAG TPA: DsbA family protein [Candidatus Binataceae bacterium]|nr:DsbA family protein [Candidatus Binataceae bacterium]
MAEARLIVPIYFDYASTLCYIAWRIVRELEAELAFTPLWKGVPIRLRDRKASPGNSLGPIEREKIATVIAETGVPVTAPEIWIDSEAALMGSELARRAGAFEPFHTGVFRAAFELRQDIADLDRLSEIAVAAGMEGEEFRRNLENRLTAGQIAENHSEAERFSALGFPTFMLGEFPLIGIQPKETMRLLLRRFLEQRREQPQA